MRIGVPALAVLVLVALSAVGVCEEVNDLARARIFLAGRRAPEQSATRQFHDYLALDRNARATAEADAWESSGHSIEMEETLRFLHGMKHRMFLQVSPWRGWTLAGGAVVWWDIGLNMGNGGVLSVDPRSYTDFFAKAPRFELPMPSAESLLAFPSHDARRLPYLSRTDFAAALGEACAADDGGFASLLRRFDASPDDDVLTCALGWTRRPAAIDRLSARVRGFAAWIDAGNRHPQPGDGRRYAVAALRRASAAEFDRVLTSMSPELDDRVVAFLGQSEVMRRRLDSLDAASSPDARRAVLRRLCDTGPFDEAGEWFLRLPRGDDAIRLTRALVEAVDSTDSSLRDAALSLVERYVPQAANEFEPFLRTLAAALTTRRVAVPTMLPSSQGVARQLLVSPRTSDLAQFDSGVPLRIDVRRTEGGIAMRLTNASSQPFAYCASAMRLATAYRMGGTDADPNGPILRLTLGGWFDAYLTFDPDDVAVLGAGKSAEFEIPLARRHRSATKLRIELRPQAVCGRAAAPLIFFWEFDAL